MNPPIKGPNTGPINGERVYRIMGAWILAGGNKSDTVPADTLRKALPDNPSNNLPKSIVSMFFAKAHCIFQMKKRNIEIR
jgi:hypothetical protein